MQRLCRLAQPLAVDIMIRIGIWLTWETWFDGWVDGYVRELSERRTVRVWVVIIVQACRTTLRAVIVSVVGLGGFNIIVVVMSGVEWIVHVRR